MSSFMKSTAAAIPAGPPPATNTSTSYFTSISFESAFSVVPAASVVFAVSFGVLFDAQDAITDPNQTVTWTSSDPSVFTVEPGAVEQNDGSKKIKAVGLGTAALTADAGPYGKETITVTVEQRKFELVLLDQMEPAYTGLPIQPKPLTVVVSRTADDPMITAVEGKDFKMEYKDNVKCGKAHAILVGIGDYEGVEYTADFTIVPTRSEITGGTDYEMRYKGFRWSLGGIYKFTAKNSLQANFTVDRFRYGKEYDVATKTNAVGDYVQSKKQRMMDG